MDLEATATRHYAARHPVRQSTRVPLQTLPFPHDLVAAKTATQNNFQKSTRPNLANRLSVVCTYRRPRNEMNQSPATSKTRPDKVDLTVSELDVVHTRLTNRFLHVASETARLTIPEDLTRAQNQMVNLPQTIKVSVFEKVNLPPKTTSRVFEKVNLPPNNEPVVSEMVDLLPSSHSLAPQDLSV